MVGLPILKHLEDLSFDDVITVDPHLHRTHNLADAVLLGLDSESEQWVRSIAEGGGLVYGVANKQRLGDREIHITLPDLDLAEKSVVLVDDVISSGETIAVAAQRCFESGARRVDVLVTHPLFAQGAIERLRQGWERSGAPTASCTRAIVSAWPTFLPGPCRLLIWRWWILAPPLPRAFVVRRGRLSLLPGPPDDER